MGAVILQADVSAEARKSEAKEKYSEKCEFDKSLEGIYLRPISFISISTVLPLEKSINRFVVGASTVRRAIGNFRKYLWGTESTVLSKLKWNKRHLNQRLLNLMWYTGGDPKLL